MEEVPSDPATRKAIDDGVNLHDTTDVAVWASEFYRTFPACGIDEGTMIGWFANAMMAKSDAIIPDLKAKARTERRRDAVEELYQKWILDDLTGADFDQAACLDALKGADQ